MDNIMLSEIAYKNRLENTRCWKKAHPNYEKEYYKKNRKKRLKEQKDYRERNKEKISSRRKKRYYERLDIIRARRKEYYKKNCEKLKAKVRIYNSKPETKKKRKLYKREYYKKNKTTLSIKQKEYNSRPEVKIRRNTNKVARRLSDPHYRLRLNISSGVRIRLKNRGQRKDAPIDKILPFKIPDLIKRLESMFKPGMTWENYGYWHVDHIIADSKFDYTTFNCPSFKQSWALDNLQPLWAHENCSKGSK